MTKLEYEVYRSGVAVMDDEETCEVCGCTEIVSYAPACPYCGAVVCTLCVNEYGHRCDPEDE